MMASFLPVIVSKKKCLTNSHIKPEKTHEKTQKMTSSDVPKPAKANLCDVCWVSGRFATGKVRHKIGRFATAMEGSPQMS